MTQPLMEGAYLDDLLAPPQTLRAVRTYLKGVTLDLAIRADVQRFALLGTTTD